MTPSEQENQEFLQKDEALIYDWRIHSIRRALKEKGKAIGKLQIEDLLELQHLDQYHSLKENGCIYIEDYVANYSLPPQIQTTLDEVVQASYVPTRETY